jgi:predicted glutamine amidotransferase
MCIIMFQKEGNERFPKKWVKRAARINDDGMGIIWASKGKLHIYRTLTDLGGIWRRYCSARDIGAAVGLHFRIRTHGDVSKDNCHPFVVNRDANGQPTMAMMHNGVVGGLGDLPEGHSDTRHFADEVISKLPKGFLQNNAMREVITRGALGKYLFMLNDGYWMILRSESGHWDEKENSWFSNYSYKEYERTVHQRSSWKPGQVWDADKKMYVDDPKLKKNGVGDGAKDGDEWWETYDHDAASCVCFTCMAVRRDARRAEQAKRGKKKNQTPKHLPGVDKHEEAVKSCPWCGERGHTRGGKRHKTEVLQAILKRDPSLAEKWSEEIFNDGFLYKGMVCCYGCLPDDAEGHECSEIALPVGKELICAWCDEELYAPDEEAIPFLQM